MTSAVRQSLEVDVRFVVKAKDQDEAVLKLRAWLDKQTITLESGVRSYSIA